ncbi:MAG: type II secretion system secretin GspD [Gammaproteobacteria bacterium]|nr:type II secretion system secretin GspD [Gammaproteobacteria bacterium]
MCNKKLALVAVLLGVLLGVSRWALAEPVTLNFKDADIRAVIGTVSEITGKNFIVDPRVNGKISIISSKPMEKEDIYALFESVLEVHGFAAVPSGKAIKIVPDANAKFGAIPTTTDAEPGEGDELVTRVVELNNVSSAQLVPIIRPLASPQAHMAAFPQANMLVISDRAANIERLVKIIRRIDLPSSDELEVIPLHHASAVEMARILTTLEQQSKRNDPTAKQTIILSDERTNSILINGEGKDRLRLRATISHLDTPTEDGGGNIHVVYLRYAKASDLVPVLTGVAKSKPVVSTGPRAADAVSPAPGVPATVDFGPPQNAPAPGQPPLPTPLIPEPVIGGGSSGANVTISIQADESANALVITAPAGIFRALESVIRQLDVRRAQVLVEAVIAEISTDKSANLGIQWAYDGTGDGSGPVGISNLPGSGNSLVGIITSIVGKQVPSIGTGVTLGTAKVTGATNFALLLQALASDADTNVLSTPTLVTMDNEQAEIVVAQNVPFITGRFTPPVGTGPSTANPFQTIERKDVGLTLKVKPQINEGDAIKLELTQEVSSLAASVTGASDLVTNKRSIKTSVIVDDGKILVLGGLIRDDQLESVQKIPGLGDLPLVGALFRTTSSTLRKTNLMVFLHPSIIRDAATGDRLTGEKYNYIRAKQLESTADGVSLMPDEKPSELPPIEDRSLTPRPSPDTPGEDTAPLQ